MTMMALAVHLVCSHTVYNSGLDMWANSCMKSGVNKIIIVVQGPNMDRIGKVGGDTVGDRNLNI